MTNVNIEMIDYVDGKKYWKISSGVVMVIKSEILNLSGMGNP